MQEQTTFSEQYKKLVDGNLAPDEGWTGEMLKGILSRVFSRDPPEADVSNAARAPNFG